MTESVSLDRIFGATRRLLDHFLQQQKLGQLVVSFPNIQARARAVPSFEASSPSPNLLRYQEKIRLINCIQEKKIGKISDELLMNLSSGLIKLMFNVL